MQIPAAPAAISKRNEILFPDPNSIGALLGAGAEHFFNLRYSPAFVLAFSRSAGTMPLHCSHDKQFDGRSHKDHWHRSGGGANSKRGSSGSITGICAAASVHFDTRESQE
jgi:hypothetical protein